MMRMKMEQDRIQHDDILKATQENHEKVMKASQQQHQQLMMILLKDNPEALAAFIQMCYKN